MKDLPAELKYAPSHEWVRAEDEGIYAVGITQHAQELLGDMVFVELPDIGQKVSCGDACAVAESVKAASDIYSPLSGVIIEVNSSLESSPEYVNNSPYEDGWLFKIKADDEAELAELLDAEDYQDRLAEEI